MAKNKDTFYFSHDYNARRDPKILALRSVYGAEGYGWWWMLLEILREQENYKLDILQKFAYASLATEMGTTQERCKEFIKACIEDFELLECDGQILWSESMIRRMEWFEEKRKKLSERGKKGAAVKHAKTDENVAQAPESAGTSTDLDCLRHGTSTENGSNKRKEKKRKEKENNKIEELVADAADAAKQTVEKANEAQAQMKLAAKQQNFYNELKAFVGQYPPEMLRSFFNYWSEPNNSRTKMRRELEKTWETPRRLANWANRDKNIANPSLTHQQQQTDAQRILEQEAAAKQKIEAKYGAQQPTAAG